jgi:hypothetical protein
VITELEALFRQLVREIAAAEPERLHRPMAVADVTGRFLPYRVARRTLDVHAADEYETLLVRLFAGEGSLVHLEDPAVRERFAVEAANPLPDLEILRREAEAQFRFWTEALAYAMGPGDRAYAPPEELEEVAAEVEVAGPAAADPGGEGLDDEPFGIPIDPAAAGTAPGGVRYPVPSAEGDRCGYCGGLLPEGRAVNFCPHCGQSQTGARCPECRNDVEEGWRHCITCGFPLGVP